MTFSISKGQYILPFDTIRILYILTITILALSVPFELGVDFNDDEFCTANTAANTCEFYGGATQTVVGAGGILGFNLCYNQVDV